MTRSSDFPWPADWTALEREKWRQLQQQVSEARQLVLATGVFDLFHQEHGRFLERAGAVGDALVVGVESNERVKQMKGDDRPYDSQEIRLENVRTVSQVTVAEILPVAFTRPEHYRAFLLLLRPKILAVSSHSPHQERKSAMMEEIGGKLVIVHDHNPEVSTTKLLEQRRIELHD